MQGNQRLVIGQDAVAVQVLDGDGQLDSGLAVGGLGEDTLVAEGKVNRSTVSRAGLGGLLYGDDAVGGGYGIILIVLIIVPTAGSAAGGNDISTGLVKTQGNRVLAVGGLAVQSDKLAVFPNADFHSVVGTGVKVTAGAIQSQGEGLARIHSNLGLIKPAEPVVGALQNRGV